MALSRENQSLDNPRTLVETVTLYLEQQIKENANLKIAPSKSFRIFYCDDPPNMPLVDYLSRIIDRLLNGKDIKFIMIAMLVNINRYLAKDSTAYLNKLNVHLMVITSIGLVLGLSAKTAEISTVGGLSSEEIIELQNAFLTKVETGYVADSDPQIKEMLLLLETLAKNPSTPCYRAFDLIPMTESKTATDPCDEKENEGLWLNPEIPLDHLELVALQQLAAEKIYKDKGEHYIRNTFPKEQLEQYRDQLSKLSFFSNCLKKSEQTLEERVGLGKQLSCLLQNQMIYEAKAHSEFKSNSLFNSIESFPNVSKYIIPLINYFFTLTDETIYPILVIYLKRYFVNNKNDWLHPYNIKHLVLIAMCVASKVHADYPIHQEALRKFMNIPMKEFNSLEIAFLNTIQHLTHVSVEEFKAMDTLIKSTTHHPHVIFLDTKERTDTIPDYFGKNKPIIEESVRPRGFPRSYPPFYY